MALSTTEAEYIAATHAAKGAIWLSALLSDLGLQATPVHLNGDNTGALELAHNPDSHGRTKHMRLRYHFIRDCVADGQISFSYVPTSMQAADALTKPVSSEALAHFRAAASLFLPP